jgi:hypothetical protein
VSKVNELLAHDPKVRDKAINVFAMSVVPTAMSGHIADELQPEKRLLRIAAQIPG